MNFNELSSKNSIERTSFSFRKKSANRKALSSVLKKVHPATMLMDSFSFTAIEAKIPGVPSLPIKDQSNPLVFEISSSILVLEIDMKMVEKQSCLGQLLFQTLCDLQYSPLPK